MDESTTARIAIAAIIAELSNAGDAGDIDRLAKLFSPEGIYTLPDRTSATGPEAIEQMLTGFSENMQKIVGTPAFMRHNATTSHIEVRGDGEATGDTYFLNVNDKGLDHWGRWRDRFTRDGGGQWLFASREVVVEGMAATSWLKRST